MRVIDVDVATLIADFAADEQSTSLELPHMTTGQRKATTKMLEEYPDLHCDSFGFGADRRLHLFKKSATQVRQDAKHEDVAFPVMHAELQVRNTFIHICENDTVDERVVQSMPHGMFRQCILSERSTDYAISTPSSEPEAEPVISPVCDEADTVLQHSPGALVVVEGLVKVPAFNGRSAVIQGFDEETGRYNILLASSGGCQHAKVKEENLRVILPCP